MSSEGPLLMLDPPVRRSRRFTGSLQAHLGRKRVVTAGLPRPGGVFGQFQYLSPPVRARASLDRQTPLTSWPPSSPEPPGNQQALFRLPRACVRAEEPASSKVCRRLGG